jgi:hypothetical protein
VVVENRYDPDPADTTWEMTFVYLIWRAGQLEIETDHHLGGLFPLETWLLLLREVGFAVELSEWVDMPTFVGLKPLLDGV